MSPVSVRGAGPAAGHAGPIITRTLAVLLGTSAGTGQLRMNVASKVLAGDTTPGFTIDLAHEDLALALGAAHGARVPEGWKPA